MMLSLSTTFFYQNCSEIETTSTAASKSASKADITYLPLFTDQLKMLGSKKEIGTCKKINEVLYSETHNLCFEVSDSCGFALLLGHGFKVVERALSQKSTESETGAEFREPSLEDRVKNCQIFVDITDLKPQDFMVISANDLGYVPDSDQMCSQSIESLVNFKNRTCVTASDGCISGFLKKSGFVKDYYSICPNSF